jgi:hypothetical protein
MNINLFGANRRGNAGNATVQWDSSYWVARRPKRVGCKKFACRAQCNAHDSIFSIGVCVCIVQARPKNPFSVNV